MANERHTDYHGWEVDSSTRQSVHSYTKYDPFREALSTTASTLKTLSPGSIKLTKQVSIPAEPVPETGTVSPLLVPINCLRNSLMSSIRVINAGSRCPMVGFARALYTEQETPEGPGPIRRISGIWVN